MFRNGVLQYFWLEEYLNDCHIGESMEIAAKYFSVFFSCSDFSAVGCFLGCFTVTVIKALSPEMMCLGLVSQHL